MRKKERKKESRRRRRKEEKNAMHEANLNCWTHKTNINVYKLKFSQVQKSHFNIELDTFEIFHAFCCKYKKNIQKIYRVAKLYILYVYIRSCRIRWKKNKSKKKKAHVPLQCQLMMCAEYYHNTSSLTKMACAINILYVYVYFQWIYTNIDICYMVVT